MPSGDVRLLAGDADVSLLIDCASAICDLWPNAVVEDTAAGEFAHSVDALVPSQDSELCVYQDLDVARRWQHGGPPGDLYNSMVQIRLDPHGLVLIADDWNDAGLARLIAKLQNIVSRVVS